MSKKRNRNRAHWGRNKYRKLAKLGQQAGGGHDDFVNVVAWNCNGLLRQDKVESVAEAIYKHDIDVVLLSETHIRSGAVENLSALQGLVLSHKNRAGFEKHGGDSLWLDLQSITQGLFPV